MPQQINLSAPLELADRQSFTARTMAQAVVVFVLLGGVLSGTWLWNLKKAGLTYTQTLADQARDIQGLKTALEAARSAAAPLDASMAQQLQTKKAELARREQLLAGIQQGLYAPGLGHSDRLQLLARSIPDVVWIQEVKADDNRIEIKGFTLEPSALNEWVSRMAKSPLLQGLKLTTVQVDHMQLSSTAPVTAVAAPAAGPASGMAGQRPSWAFHLVTGVPAQSKPAEARP